MGLSYEEISKLIDFKELSKGLENVHAIQLQVPKPPNFDYGEEFKCIREKKQREEIREIEDNQNLKDISEKMNSLNSTLKFLSSGFEDKFQFDKENSQEQNELLSELITIIKDKDKDRLKQFINNISNPVVAGLILHAINKIFGF